MIYMNVSVYRKKVSYPYYPPQLKIYKYMRIRETSCWPCYWRLAQEALTFNWPPVCFEPRPPITIPRK